MNTIIDRLYHVSVPSGFNLPAQSNPSAFRWNPGVILVLAAMASAGTIPVQAALVEASLNPVVGSNSSAEMFLARPGVFSLNWLAVLGLDVTWKRPLADSTQQLQIAAAFRRMPLSFEPNVGQSDPQVRFLVRGPDYTLFLTASAEAVVVSGKEPSEVARMGLAGANPQPDVRALEERAAKSYYFIGNDPARWHTKVPNYGRVRYQAVYPGIDLVYYGNQQQLEYDLLLAPGADPSRIELIFQEARQLRLNPESGDVEVTEGGGAVCLHKPVVYQMAKGQKREAIEASYVLATGNRVRLALGPYDTTRPMVIDPILVYSTYLGGSSAINQGNGIAVDARGNAYVTGVTYSPDFRAVKPVQAFFPLAHPLPTNSVLQGPYEAFVGKLRFDARTGTLALAYSIYLGGSGGDLGTGIAVDTRGDAYVTGTTGSSDFPLVHPLPTNRVLRAVYSAFVSKLSFDDRTGTLSLAYSTYLGGSNLDVGYAIAVDTCGNAYVTGGTESSDFPLAHPLPTNSILRGSVNAFVSKLSFDVRTDTLALIYSSYLGGSGDDDDGFGIAVDSRGDAYVTGETGSPDFPLAHPLPTNSGLRGFANAFVSKLSFDARSGVLALAYSSYLGGSGFERGNAIAVDDWGNAYVTGITSSPDFPLAHPLPTNNALRGTEAAFVSKLSFETRTATLALGYSTYLGGSGDDGGYGIAVDRRGNAYVVGDTSSPDFPLVDPLPNDNTLRGIYTVFVSKLSFEARTPTLALAYSTYLGGSNHEEGFAIAADSHGDAYVTGRTESPDFPLVHPLSAYSSFNATTEAFAVKIRSEPFEGKNRDRDADQNRCPWGAFGDQ
jgi:beta-propeller repeat-containing protein